MLKEIIVVEGKRDAAAVRRAVAADIIITGGYALPEGVLAQIRRARDCRGVIVLTDPDYAGERIRQRINRAVPGCKHAFIPREEASSDDDIGVEQASPAAILAALGKVRVEMREPRWVFDWSDLWRHGLAGEGGAARRRANLGKLLGIGYGNAKQFLYRLNAYGVTRREFAAAIDQMDLLGKEGSHADQKRDAGEYPGDPAAF